MEHMKERWRVGDEYDCYVYTVSGLGVFHAYDNKLALAICDQHNAFIDCANPTITPPHAQTEQPAKSEVQPQMSNAELQAAIDSAMRGYDGATGEAAEIWRDHLCELLVTQADRARGKVLT